MWREKLKNQENLVDACLGNGYDFPRDDKNGSAVVMRVFDLSEPCFA